MSQLNEHQLAVLNAYLCNYSSMDFSAAFQIPEVEYVQMSLNADLREDTGEGWADFVEVFNTIFNQFGNTGKKTAFRGSNSKIVDEVISNEKFLDLAYLSSSESVERAWTFTDCEYPAILELELQNSYLEITQFRELACNDEIEILINRGIAFTVTESKEMTMAQVTSILKRPPIYPFKKCMWYYCKQVIDD